MHYSDSILGTNTTHALRERASSALLTIGRDRFTRADLAQVECFNYVAAQNLSNAIATFNVANTRDLFERVPPSALALPRVGAIALAVLGAAFEAKNIGGVAPLEAWVRRHADDETNYSLVTFHTIKRQEAAALSAERKEEKKRQRARREKARTLRGDRILDRAAERTA